MPKSTYILGINAFHADAGAALLKDGILVAAVTEERLNRVKHFAGCPLLAVKEVLDLAGISLEEVDHIALNKDNKANLKAKLGFVLSNLHRIPKMARQRLMYRAKARKVPEMLATHLGVQHPLAARIHHVEHHLCHAASAYLVSDFERAAIFSVDGFGDFASTMTALGEGNHIKILDRTLFPHSLGILYTMVCQFIGYAKYGDEGKVMGLAPYGKPAYEDFFNRLVRLLPGGKFELDLNYFRHHVDGVDYSFDEQGHPTVAPLFTEAMGRMFGPARQPQAELTTRDKDLAASLQKCLEKAYFHVLNHLHEKTRCENLCLAGGVALNSVANGMIFDQTPFRNVYTQAAAGDDGTALGAASYIHHGVLGHSERYVMEHAYTGREYSNTEIKVALDWVEGVTVDLAPEEDVYRNTAQALARGEIVGWFQGKMEWGPRALGNRSILAHPGLPGMKDLLNARIKHREWFRPFAPSILLEKVGEYFEHTHPSPYMMMVYRTRPEKRASLCAVNHVDDTGRLQTVSACQNRRYHALLKAFEKETSLPVLLNTSFNENEPIVCSPADALACFLRTRIDLLVMGNWLVRKKLSLHQQ